MDSFDKLGLSLIRRSVKNEVETVQKVDHAGNNSEGESKVKSRASKLTNSFKKQFHSNNTVEGFVYIVQFKPKIQVMQQKGRGVPIHMQKAVEAKLKKRIDGGHIEKLTELGEDTFVSPLVITKKATDHWRLPSSQ